MSKTLNSPGVPFTTSQARILLRNKYVLFLGDSVQRGMYKDFVAFLHNREMLTTEELQKTGEPSFRGDHLLYATEKNLGSEYCEIREYTGYSQKPCDYLKNEKDTRTYWDGTILVRYAFITRAWRKDLHTRRILDNLTLGRSTGRF